MYINDVFELFCQNCTTTRASLLKLNEYLKKTNHGKNNLSYIAPNIWNKLPDFLKKTDKEN